MATVVDRTAIKNALFAKVSAAVFPVPIAGATTWRFVTRRLKLWNAIDPSVQPAMCMVQHQEDYVNTGAGTPPKRYLEMGLWCYARTDSDDILGDDLLDYMMMGLEAALAPDDTPRNELTLGGLVYWARILRRGGMFIRDPGDIDGQALLILPIQILIP